MVMENPNSYARPIKHLEKGMDFGVSNKLYFSHYWNTCRMEELVDKTLAWLGKSSVIVILN